MIFGFLRDKHTYPLIGTLHILSIKICTGICRVSIQLPARLKIDTNKYKAIDKEAKNRLEGKKHG